MKMAASESIAFLEQTLEMPHISNTAPSDVEGKKHVVLTHPGFPWADVLDSIYNAQVKDQVHSIRTDRSWAQHLDILDEGSHDFDVAADIQKIATKLSELIEKSLDPEFFNPEIEDKFLSQVNAEQLLLRNQIATLIGSLREMIREISTLQLILSRDDLVVSFGMGVPDLDIDSMKERISQGLPIKKNLLTFGKNLIDHFDSQAERRFFLTSGIYAPHDGYNGGVSHYFGFAGIPTSDPDPVNTMLYQQIKDFKSMATINPEITLMGSYVDQCVLQTMSDLCHLFSRVRFPVNLCTGYGSDHNRALHIDPSLRDFVNEIKDSSTLDEQLLILQSRKQLRDIIPINYWKFFRGHYELIRSKFEIKRSSTDLSRVDLSGTTDIEGLFD